MVDNGFIFQGLNKGDNDQKRTEVTCTSQAWKKV